MKFSPMDQGRFTKLEPEPVEPELSLPRQFVRDVILTKKARNIATMGLVETVLLVTDQPFELTFTGALALAYVIVPDSWTGGGGGGGGGSSVGGSPGC